MFLLEALINYILWDSSSSEPNTSLNKTRLQFSPSVKPNQKKSSLPSFSLPPPIIPINHSKVSEAAILRIKLIDLVTGEEKGNLDHFLHVNAVKIDKDVLNFAITLASSSPEGYNTLIRFGAEVPVSPSPSTSCDASSKTNA